MSEPLLKCENNAILSKTILKNCLFLLKYPILAVLGLGEILNFQISSKKSFITSTTGPNPIKIFSVNFTLRLLEPISSTNFRVA